MLEIEFKKSFLLNYNRKTVYKLDFKRNKIIW